MRLALLVLLLGFLAGPAFAQSLPIVYTSLDSVRYDLAGNGAGEQTVSLELIGDDSVTGQKRQFRASVEVPLDEKIRWILNQCKSAANKVLAKPAKFDVRIEVPFENPAEIDISIGLGGLAEGETQVLVCTLMPASP